MSSFDLLQAVQPSEGWFVVFGLKNGDRRQKLVETREEFDTATEQLVAAGYDAYFGVAKYATKSGRTKENVRAAKAFWMDIDCGESKAVVNEKTGKPNGYIDQSTAITELCAFCEKLGLPIPIMVNSGRGVHAYWALTEEVTRDKWEPVANRLRELCAIHDLHADPSVFEIARVLRTPGTYNFKGEEPLPVELICEGDPTSYEDFRNILGVKEAEVIIPKRELTDLGKTLQENIESSFSKIMRRSATYNGCQQLLECFQEQETLSEPRWFNALSIAKFCKDQESAIHKLSNKHPGYDPVATIEKIAHIKGPHSCEQFERNNPKGCEGCPFKGKITSPISLGKELIVSTGEDNVVIVPPEVEGQEPEKHIIPDCPHPFARGKNGGIYLIPQEEEAEPILVYQHDLFVKRRVHHPLEGEAFVLTTYMPMEGWKDIFIYNRQLVDKIELRTVLANAGVICINKKLDYLLQYVTSAAQDFQCKVRAERMRLQFGWADNDRKFIIGDREISAEGTFHSPPSSATAPMVEKMQKKGSLAKWKEVFNLYGRPGLEPVAFATLSAFGSPLFKFTGQMGAMINLVYPGSGSGKSTTLHMINSVYGQCRMFAVDKDTQNAKVQSFGIMNNIPITIDEITNMKPDAFSDLIYLISQGRGKERMRGSANELRANHVKWNSSVVSTSNAYMSDKLLSIKDAPDGELMRMIEYRIEYSDVIETAFAKDMFDVQLHENYGHAGDIYAEYLVSNLEKVKEGLRNMQRKIDTEFKFTSRERNWSALIACNMYGGYLAKTLGLLDWDLDSIYKWTYNMLKSLRENHSPPVADSIQTVGRFIYKYQHCMLVVNDAADKRTNIQMAPLREPKGELMIRYEPDTKKLFILCGKLRNFCSEFQTGCRDTLIDLEQKGVYLGTINRRMGKGMATSGPTVSCLVFDTSNPEFMGMEEYEKPLPKEEAEDESGGD
jgi:hypothetical protein